MKRLLLFFMLMLAGFFSPIQAQSIQNPYYSTPDWKLWYEDQSPATVDGVTLDPRPESHRDYPVDPTPAEAATGLYMKVVPDDYPGRRYSGFFNDGYDSRDRWHTNFPWEMVFDGGNRVTASGPTGGAGPSPEPRYIRGSAYIRFDKYGIQFTNQSDAGQGHYITQDQTNDIEENFYFKNMVRAGPAFSSYQTGSYSYDKFPALFPAFFNGDGASYSQFGGYGKMMYAGAYLPIPTKKKLLRNGLFASTVLYNWKSNLPYKVPYDHMLRHRVSYSANGILQEGYNVPSSFEYMAHFHNHYDANLHMANMVAQYKTMDVTAPVTLIHATEIIQGAYNSNVQGAENNKTLVALEHPASGDRSVIVRISTEDSFDLQGYPLTVRAKVLYGNKDTQVDRESEHIWKITVPWSDTLPEGRTDLIFVANNGVYDSNPAVVSVMRPYGDDKTADGYSLVRTPSGLPQMTRIVPGENIAFDLSREDADGLPISY